METNPSTPSSEPEDQENLDAMLREENDIRDQVFNWFLVLNGLLFTALSFAWSPAATSRTVCQMRASRYPRSSAANGLRPLRIAFTSASCGTAGIEHTAHLRSILTGITSV